MIFSPKKGFTLIELMVVIAIFGLLASIVLAAVTSARQKAQLSGVAQEFHQLQNALELYLGDGGLLDKIGSGSVYEDSPIDNNGHPNGQHSYYNDFESQLGGDIAPGAVGKTKYISSITISPFPYSDSTGSGLVFGIAGPNNISFVIKNIYPSAGSGNIISCNGQQLGTGLKTSYVLYVYDAGTSQYNLNNLLPQAYYGIRGGSSWMLVPNMWCLVGGFN